MKKIILLLVMLVITNGCGILEKEITWQEQVVLTGGSIITLNRIVVMGSDAFFRPGKGGPVRSSMSGVIPGIGEVDFRWDDYEMPISFDIVDGTPWIILPIGGPEPCEKYGYPKESVVAFYYSGSTWIASKFEDAPKGLRTNLLTSPPFDERVVFANDLIKQRYDHRTKGFVDGYIQQHIKSEHSCPRINPTAAPEQVQSVNEYLTIKSKHPTIDVLSVYDNIIRIDNIWDYRGVLAKRDPLNDEFIVSGCQDVVGRVESTGSWMNEGGGRMSKHMSAIRIELSNGGQTPNNIWLPNSKSGGTPALIQCTNSNGYVLIPQWGADQGLVIAQFDFNGVWTNVWHLEYPEACNNHHGIIRFEETPGSFILTLGEINHIYRHQDTDPWATIGKRCLIKVSDL